MAKAKVKKKAEKFGEPRGSVFRSVLHFFTLTPVWQILLITAVIALIAWQWGNITTWYRENVFRIFGWGILILIAAAITLVTVICKRKLSLFITYWNRWLAGIVLCFFLWGILALFPGKGVLTAIGLGGKFGLGIVGGTDLGGVFRVLFLFIAGVVLMFPTGCYRVASGSMFWLIDQIKRPGFKPMKESDIKKHYDIFEPPKITPKREKARRPFGTEEDDKPAIEALQEKVKERVRPLPVPEFGSDSSRAKRADKEEESVEKDLKQVAQDVWRKYGESPDLVIVDGWKLPPIEILDVSPEIQFSQADNAERARLIEEAFTSYGVEAKVVQINAGPTVTQFGVEPGWDRKIKEIREKDKDGNTVVRQEEVSKTRVKVDRITSLQNDLALALAAPSIRIEAPVPGKAIVGIEVPNTISTVVSLRGVIETNAFQKLQAKSTLALALGKGAGGEAVAGDLSKMPHLLIAGATGSGKTVCLNAVVCCLLLNNSPSDVRFIMIDPKRVELTTFNSIPHLATPVIVESDKAIESLRWLGREMNNRYQILASAGKRNIDGYNKNREGEDRMPYLVLVIDELADLMMTGGDEVEQILCRLAQLSRAVGIHLVVATQRPSVDVITGLIKANFPTRISFAVTSQVDSRTILDIGGAEKLMGSGDMLFLPTEASKPKRLQGCYVSDAEAERLVYFWGNQQKGDVIPLLKPDELILTSPTIKGGHPEDSLMDAARDLARNHDNVSTSFLQRRLHIGYPRAARIMDQLEMEMAEWEKEEDPGDDDEYLEDFEDDEKY
ncbi:MAG: DNA translocase FtsK [Dehalococcoidales bacterium]|nr:MAG: DNA translocase FtsK [Dehalococcoidales bacterium]